jgi:hypothetical protein
MTISTKHRRSISVEGNTYLWWVTEDLEDDFVGSLVLTVASKDRRLFVRYGLVQPNDRRHVVVLGPQFRDLVDAPGPWRRFACPAFGAADRITPKDVAEFVHWCTTAGPLTEVDYRGLPIHLSG